MLTVLWSLFCIFVLQFVGCHNKHRTTRAGTTAAAPRIPELTGDHSSHHLPLHHYNHDSVW